VPLRIEDLDYDLPADRIAQQPAARRDAARLLVMRRGTLDIRHATVAELPGLLPDRTLLVVNDTRVLPARLLGKRESTGGKAEVLLVRPLSSAAPAGALGPRPGGSGLRASPTARPVVRWSALLQTRGKPRTGERFLLGALRATFVERLPNGEFCFDLAPVDPRDSVETALQRSGAMPLPPYIKRAPDPADADRYQTVYAERPGAVAAPTAGLHFTPELLARLESAGHEVARVTLHVGPGTFRPITAAQPEAHTLEAEWAELSERTAATIARARREGRTVLAVGTTVVRTLETAAARSADPIASFSGDTALYILPGHTFRALDALMTNFHLPRTTLLGLVMAFHGLEPTRAAYAAAIRQNYRFYSYGDAMLVLP
jgi:S-adenosylmethionine:tRNA ribosyltransferase-isomerase